MEEKNNKSILGQAILAAICSWVFVSIFKLPFYVKNTGAGFGWTVGGKTLAELQREIIDSGLVKWIFEYLYSVFFSVLDFFVIISVFIGFCLALKFFYKNKYKLLLFILPLIFIIISSFIIATLYFFGPSGDSETIMYGLGFLIFFTVLPYLFFSFIISLFFYFKKEYFLKFGAGFIFIIAFIGLMGFGKYNEVKGLEEKKQAAIIDESVLKPLLARAIKEADPALCEELNREINKIENEGRLIWFEGKEGIKYHACIIEVGRQLGDESLCGVGESICKKIISNTKEFLQKTDLCREISESKQKIECIREIALDTNNAELCAGIYDLDCVVEIAKKINSSDVCGKFKDVSYYNESTAYQANCIKKLQGVMNGPAICGSLENTMDQSTCLFNTDWGGLKCVDTDGGEDYYKEGIAAEKVDKGISFNHDCCSEYPESGAPCNQEIHRYLHEAVCENGKPSSVAYDCPKGCQDGVCLK